MKVRDATGDDKSSKADNKMMIIFDDWHLVRLHIKLV